MAAKRPAENRAPGQAGEAAPSFDERLARLQTIVSELEQVELGLEPAIERYQEGIELLKECHAVLSGYRKRVEELSAEAEAGLKPYASDPDFGAPSGSAGS